MATILPTGKQSFISNSGAPLAGGKLYTYAAGTSTPKRTYADAGATTPNANPIILDSRGEAAVFWSGAYKATLKDANDSLIWTVDNIRDQAFPGVSAADFGATGDGTTDDTAAFQAFLNHGGDLYAGTGTYTLTGAAVPGVANTSLNFAPGVVFDFRTAVTPGLPNSPWSNTAFGLSFHGSIGSAVLLTANALADQNTAVVADASGFAVDDWIVIQSSALFETDTNTKIGEFKQIIGIAGNTLTFAENLYLTYNTSDTAKVKKMSFCENIRIRGNATFLGNYAGTRSQAAILFQYCRNFVVEDITTLKTDYVGIQTYKCLDGAFTRVRCIKDSYTGGNIGIAHVYGSSNMAHTDCVGYDLCHFIDVSGDTSNGGISMNIIARGCRTYQMGGASFNTHPGAGGVVDFSHNIVQMKNGLTSATPTGMVAIRCQAPQFIAVGNYCYNVTGHGIFHQIETTQPVQRETTIIGNKMFASPTNQTDFPGNIGVVVQGYVSAGDVGGVVIQGNEAYGFLSGISVYGNVMNLYRCNISANIYDCLASASNYGIYVRTFTGYVVSGLTINGNNIKATGAGQGIYLQGVDVGSINTVSMAGNVVDGSTYAIRMNNCDNVLETSTAIKNVTTKYYLPGSTNVTLDRRNTPAASLTTAGTYTVKPHDEFMSANYAGTTVIALPTASAWTARELRFGTRQAQLTISNASNVVPITGGAAGTAILPATAGAWAVLKSDGTNWNVVQKG